MSGCREPFKLDAVSQPRPGELHDAVGGYTQEDMMDEGRDEDEKGLTDKGGQIAGPIAKTRGGWESVEVF